MKSSNIEKLTIDVGSISTEAELFEKLITEFDFPNLYERNWKGLEEHFFYDSMLKVPSELLLKGYSNLQANIPDIDKRLQKVFSATSLKEESFIIKVTYL